MCKPIYFFIPLLLFYSPLFAKCTIEINGDKLIKVGKIAKFTITITNNDESTINNIIIRNKLPFGFKYKQKDTDNLVLKWQVNSLKSKQQKHFSYHLEAIKDGVYENAARLYIENKNVQEMKFALQVIYSYLKVKLDGSTKRATPNKYITFTTTITNTENTDAIGVKATLFLPERIKYISSEPTERFFSSKNKVDTITWYIDKIPCEEKIEIKITAQATAIYIDSSTLYIKSPNKRCISKIVVLDGQQEISDEFAFFIQNWSTLDISTRNIKGSIEVGSQKEYIVTIRNGGTSACTNITFQNDLPKEMEFISADGPTHFSYNHLMHRVIFKPYTILQPGDNLVFKIICKAIKSGSVKNKALLNYSELSVGIMDEEETIVHD